MEAAHHEHQVMLMRQDWMRLQELKRIEELPTQDMQKQKHLELRQEEEHWCREEDMQ